MAEEVIQRNRQNSGRSRHGSGPSWHEAKARHNSGDIRKRFDSESSPKVKSGRDSPRLLPNGLVNTVIKDDETIALINDSSNNGALESPDSYVETKLPVEPVASISRSASPKKSQLSGTGENEHSHSSHDSGVNSDYSGGQVGQVSDNKKKSSDSEGDSDNIANGGTDGDDDQLLLIKTKSVTKNPTSPHWKVRSRHSSSEGLRKRTRSRTDSESSDMIISGATPEVRGMAPISGVKPIDNKSPVRPNSMGSRRRRHSGKLADDVGQLVKDCRHGSHDCMPVLNNNLQQSSRQRHKSMDSTVVNACNVGQPLDNPSFVHKNSDGNKSALPELITRSPNTVSTQQNLQEKAIPKEAEECSPVTDDDTKHLISVQICSETKPHPSPPTKLDLSQVYRPSVDPNPPVHVALIQEDSFSPCNHRDANNALNNDQVQLTLMKQNESCPNGPLWHLTKLPTVEANGNVVKSKLANELKSPGTESLPEADGKEVWGANKCQAMVTLLILLLANLINYMDRVTIAGVLLDIKSYYGISRSEAGLLQTVFICSYMVFSPIFGFLGDRYNRKLIMSVGIFCWSSITLAGSFVPADHFKVFLLMRALVGIGEASYSTIAPTIIADLFVRDMRTKALAVFYFAIPVGSGLGYIIGANVAHYMGAWQWSLRVTPPLGVLCVLCIMFLVREPPRGAAEGGTHLGNTTYLADIKYLVKNKSFVFSSLGFTCVAFVAGAFSLWAPTFMSSSILVQARHETEANVALKFGVITCLAGFIGVGCGSESARRLRKKSLRADPLVCAFGLIGSAPFLFFAIVSSKYNTILAWVMIFIGETLLCLNWAIVTDIVLYIVIPTRRSTAEAIQILASHLFGDAGSPYLIGMLADTVKASMPYRSGVAADFLSLQWALYSCCFVSIIGGGFFLATAFYIVEDRARADKAIRGSTAVQRDDNDDGEDSDDVMISAGVNPIDRVLVIA